MRNFVSSQTMKVAILSFILIAAFTVVSNVSAHDNHNQTFEGFTDVYFTGYHSHDLNGTWHRHAVVHPVMAPQGIVHDKLDLWREHKHETPTKHGGTYLLMLSSTSGGVHNVIDGSTKTYVVLYARASDKDIASEIRDGLISQEIDLESQLRYDVESDTCTFQYVGQYIDGVSSVLHTHGWEHKHGNFGWHTHEVKHSHVFQEGNHPDWFGNNENLDDGGDGSSAETFMNGHETLHPSDDAHMVGSMPAKREALTLWWAELKVK
jgi:hypothetical protein